MPTKCFYATFGLAHPLRNRVQRVLVYEDNPSEELVRGTLNSFYANKWAFLYGPFDIKEGADTVVLFGTEFKLVDNDLTAGEVYQ